MSCVELLVFFFLFACSLGYRVGCCGGLRSLRRAIEYSCCEVAFFRLLFHIVLEAGLAACCLCTGFCCSLRLMLYKGPCSVVILEPANASDFGSRSKFCSTSHFLLATEKVSKR